MPGRDRVNATREVRGRLGDLAEDELPDEQIQRSLDAGERELSRYAPTALDYAVQVTPEVTDYAVPGDPAAVRLITRAAFFHLDSSSFGASRPVPFGGTGREVSGGDSLSAQWWVLLTFNGVMDRLESYQGAQLLGGSPPQIRFSPVPAVSEMVAVTLEYPKTPEEMTPIEYQHFLDWVMGDCQEYRGRQRDKRVRVIMTGAGQLRLDSGRQLLAEGRLLKKKALLALGQGSTFVAGF